MTLDVENCHSTVHIKQANLSMLEYCRSFGLTMKESIKEARKGFLGCYSVCETMKDTKEGYSIV